MEAKTARLKTCSLIVLLPFLFFIFINLSLFSRYFQGAPWSGVGYFPSFPASAPYVTAVGATQGPESDDPEIACQSQEGGVITTGT